MRRWRSILRLPRLRLPTPSCTLALSVRTRSEGERRYVSFAPVSTPYTRRALFHCSGSSATPSDTIITTRPYRAHRLLQPHLTVWSVEEALRPVSTRPAAYRRRRTICRLHLKPTVQFVRAPERRVPLSRCVATEVLRPRAARVCLSARSCRPRLRKDEKNRNPIPTSSESGEEQPSFLKQSLDAGCTTRICLLSSLSQPSSHSPSRLSLCRLSATVASDDDT